MEYEQVRLANEYRAQQAKERRDYHKAIDYTILARDAALRAGDNWGYCRHMLEIIRYQYDLGLMDDCIRTIETLTAHPAILDYPESGVRARVLYAQVLQDKGASERALRAAREAVSMVPDRSRELRTAAQHSRVATLAGDGEVEAAWREALVLDSLIGPEAGARVRGKAYWTIGNAGFLSGRIDEGLGFHRKAAAALSAVGDVSLWALFNKASACVRLEAGVVEPETLECIERAEVAISVSDGNLADRLETLLVRAHWEHAVKNSAVAEQKIRDVATGAEELFPYTRAQALLLLAECLLDLGRTDEALETARESEQVFDGLGAPVQVARTQTLISSILASGPSSKS